MQKKISLAVIKRLPKYYRYLGELNSKGIDRISSKDLSELMGFTASQIRQDLNNFGGFGQQGYGYNVENLMSEIAKLLGLENNYKAVVIGLGNLGQGLANYETFSDSGFNIVGLFDINPKLIGKSVRGIEIKNIDLMDSFVKSNNVEIAMLCVPKDKASELSEKLCELGIKGIWNFAPIDLKVKNKNVVVENVHLSESLMTLSYRIKNKDL